MTAIPIDQFWTTIELAYQEYEVDEKYITTNQLWTNFMFSYQEYAPIVRVPLPTLMEYILKIVNNVVAFAFLGKAWLFNGTSLTEFGSPAALIYPALLSDAEKAYFIGGLDEDGEISKIIYGYATVADQITADRDYFAMVVAGEEPVYLVNEAGTIMDVFQRSGATPLLKGWRLTSKNSFYAVVLKI